MQEKECTNLIVGDFREDEAAGQGLLDVREELVLWGAEGDVGRVGRAAATGEHGDDAAVPVEDYGAGVALVGEGAMPGAVRYKPGLERGKDNLDIVVDLVVTDL